MNEKQIFVKLKDIIREVFPEYKSEIVPDVKQEDIEEWDSLGHLNLFMAVEQIFNISFSMEEVTDINSIHDIIEFIKNKKN